jgi:hypothetical protein
MSQTVTQCTENNGSNSKVAQTVTNTCGHSLGIDILLVFSTERDTCVNVIWSQAFLSEHFTEPDG